MRTKQLSRAAVGTTASVALVATGIAYAYVRTTGSGNGSATAATGLSAFHTTAAVAQGATLYPGGSAPLTVIIDNSANDYALTVTSVALDTSRSITGCTSPSLTVSTPEGWSGISVAAHATSPATTIAAAVAMGAAASNDCQGAALTIPVTLTGHS